jgi:hypothetical protein
MKTFDITIPVIVFEEDAPNLSAMQVGQEHNYRTVERQAKLFLLENPPGAHSMVFRGEDGRHYKVNVIGVAGQIMEKISQEEEK